MCESVCACTCACMYVYECIYMYMCTCACVCICMYMCARTCVCVYVCVCTHVHVYMYFYMCLCVCGYEYSDTVDSLNYRLFGENHKVIFLVKVLIISFTLPPLLEAHKGTWSLFRFLGPGSYWKIFLIYAEIYMSIQLYSYMCRYIQKKNISL